MGNIAELKTLKDAALVVDAGLVDLEVLADPERIAEYILPARVSVNSMISGLGFQIAYMEEEAVPEPTPAEKEKPKGITDPLLLCQAIAKLSWATWFNDYGKLYFNFDSYTGYARQEWLEQAYKIIELVTGQAPAQPKQPAS